MSRLQEISEGAATGSVAATYAEIRRVTGVPFVVFIYRVLATEAGRLEAAWADLAPNLASAEGRAARAALEAAAPPAAAPRPAALPGDVVATSGVTAASVEAMLAGFRRANAANVVALWALLDGVAGTGEAPTGPVPAAEPVPPGLPMADLTKLAPSTIALLEEMSAPVAGPERPVLVPSMFRTFAHDEALLAALWTSLRPLLESPAFTEGVAALSAQGRALAQTLPYPVTALAGDEIRDVIARFLRAIPSMLIAGAAIGALFPEA
jgi:hypothetical protein